MNSRVIETSVDLQRVVRNAKEIAARTKAQLWATIKADAYGLGAGRVSEALAPLVAGFCLFTLEEATRIDLWNRSRKPAIVMGPPVTLDPRPWLDAHVRPAVSTVEQAEALADARPILCVDTGMQRFACPPEAIEDVLRAGRIDEAFTHATRIEHVARLLEIAGGRDLKLHAAASALLHAPEAHLDAVRPGFALYRGALTVTTHLVEVRKSVGPIGYSGWISPTGFHAVIPVGYAAGLRPGPVFVNGNRQRITEIGMQSAYVTANPTDCAGDAVTLLGHDITESELAFAWNSTPHEVIYRLSQLGGTFPQP